MKLKLLFYLIFFTWILNSCDRPKLDEYGGYYDEKIQVYRYVKVNKNPESVKGVVKPFLGKRQLIQAKVAKIDYNFVWLHLEDRNLYTLVSQDIAIKFKDEKLSWIALSLEGIGMNVVQSSSSNFNKRKKNRLDDLISKTIVDKKVPVIIESVAKGKALSGVVFFPGSKAKDLRESLNYWIIKNGLSPYVLPTNQRDIVPEYIKAEDLARKNKAGIWKGS